MNTKLIAAAALFSLSVIPAAIAGMPDAYRVGPSPNQKAASATARVTASRPPYALTGTPAKTPERPGPWKSHLHRFGTRVEQFVFTR